MPRTWPTPSQPFGVCAHLEHRLGAGVNDAFARLLDSIHEAGHDCYFLILPLYSMVMERVVCDGNCSCASLEPEWSFSVAANREIFVMLPLVSS